MKSGEGPALLGALEQCQIQSKAWPTQYGQNGMRLAAMMGLVVEQMGERWGLPLRDGAHVGYGHVGEATRKRLVAERPDPVDDPPVLDLARATQHGQSPVKIASRVVGASPSPVKRFIQMRSVVRR